MGKPAARIGDTHSCPMVNPNGTPHTGGPVIGPGCQSVLIEGKPAATAGDSCICNVGVLDKITAGATGVYIEGKLAARMKDRCAHGGVITSGSTTVLIGGRMKTVSARKDKDKDENEYKEPTAEEKVVLINQAIQDCIALLERKRALMEQNDTETMEAFEKWFGKHGDEAKVIILERIRRALEVSRRLTVGNFYKIVDEKDRREGYATSYSTDKLYSIYLGDRFWEKGTFSKKNKAGTIVHELSHFKNIGKTEDTIYGYDRCLGLAKSHSSLALFNAESFEFFIVA